MTMTKIVSPISPRADRACQWRSSTMASEPLLSCEDLGGTYVAE
jgi:hypothetical protein